MNIDENISFPSNLKILRNHHNLTFEKLSEETKIGVNSIKNYEGHSHFPSVGNLVLLASFFSVSIDFLMLWNKTNYPKNLKLINLSKQFDDYSQPQERTHIEITAKTFLNQKDIAIEIKQDNNNIQLEKNINNNILLLREVNEIGQKKLAEILEVNQSQIAHYEKNSFPSMDKLLKLSELFKVSIHALLTGEKLFFDFQDRHFGKTMLLADQLLPLEYHKILITLMETILNNQK